jgi:uncharacterized protein YciI
MINVFVLALLPSREPAAFQVAERNAWLRKHTDRGRILLSGPRPDGGAVVVTADITEMDACELAESDPWCQSGIASYERISFEPGTIIPGVATAPDLDDEVLAINVAVTDTVPDTVAALASVVEYVAANPTHDGFRGSRLLASIAGDAVVNMAAWASADQFAALWDDPEFTRRFQAFTDTTTEIKYRLYRTSRVITPNL